MQPAISAARIDCKPEKLKQSPIRTSAHATVCVGGGGGEQTEEEDNNEEEEEEK